MEAHSQTNTWKTKQWFTILERTDCQIWSDEEIFQLVKRFGLEISRDPKKSKLIITGRGITGTQFTGVLRHTKFRIKYIFNTQTTN